MKPRTGLECTFLHSKTGVRRGGVLGGLSELVFMISVGTTAVIVNVSEYTTLPCIANCISSQNSLSWMDSFSRYIFKIYPMLA